MEGLQDTLTIQRTGLLLKTAKGLRVRHCMDALRPKLRACLRTRTDRAERLAQTLLDHESTQRRIAHWAALSLLRDTAQCDR